MFAYRFGFKLDTIALTRIGLFYVVGITYKPPYTSMNWFLWAFFGHLSPMPKHTNDR